MPIIMTDQDDERLNYFFDRYFRFLESKSIFTYYAPESSHDSSQTIELMDGTLLDARTEGPLVLDNEFEKFVISNFINFMQTCLENVSSKMMGFAERPLYEYLTTWLFLFLADDINIAHKRRIKALILAGHYKFIESNMDDYNNYLSARGSFLKASDLVELNNETDNIEFFAYQWKVTTGIRNSYNKDKYRSFLNSNPDIERILSHQSMRVHANPLSINEAMGGSDAATRYKLLIAYYARQSIDYFLHSDRNECDKLIYIYNRFIRSQHLRVV